MPGETILARYSRSSLALALVLFAACSDAPPPDPELVLWSAEEEIRIGSLDGPENFVMPITMAVSEDGRIYVAERRTGTVRAYYPSGERFAVLGGRGSGPGEYSSLSGVGIIGDTLYAINQAPAYVNYYTLDGAHIGGEARSFDGGGVFRPTAPDIILSDGQAIVIATPVAGRTSDARPWLLIDTDKAVLDTIFVERIPSAPIRRGNVNMNLSVPYASPPRFALSSGHAVIGVVDWEEPTARQGEFRVSSLSREGDTIATAVYQYTPMAYADSIVDGTVQDLVKRIEDRLGLSTAEAERIVREDVYLPRYHPPVGAPVVPIDDGSVWLYRFNPRPGVEMEWQVIDPDGSRVARINLPSDLTPMVIRGEHVWGLRYDGFGVPSVVRYRISQESR